MTLYNAFSIGNGFSGEQLKITKAECIAATKRQGGAAAVQCVLTRLTTFEAALMASRQYMYVVPNIVHHENSVAHILQSHFVAGIRWRCLCTGTRPGCHGSR
jgi:hypothetical protein